MLSLSEMFPCNYILNREAIVCVSFQVHKCQRSNFPGPLVLQLLQLTPLIQTLRLLKTLAPVPKLLGFDTNDRTKKFTLCTGHCLSSQR